MPYSEANAAFVEVSRNVDRALSILLGRPENAWAADFVFNVAKDPAGDLSMLTNPFPLANAVGASIRGDSSINSPSSSAVVDYVMIPAWSIGSVTVGVSVARISNFVSPIAEEPSIVYNMGRFVRDERSAEMLIVNTSLSDSNSAESRSLEKLPKCAIVYMRHDSSTERFHFFAGCDSNLFFTGKHAESVMFSESVLHYRICPICFASPYSSCNCSIPFQVPKTYLDFSAFAPNSLSHMGAFAGTAVFVCKDQRSGRIRRQVCPSRDVFSSNADMELVKLLQDMAIQDRLLRGNLCRTVMPSGDLNSVEIGEPVSAIDESNEEDLVLNLADFELDLENGTVYPNFTELLDAPGFTDDLPDITDQNSVLPPDDPGADSTSELQHLQRARVTSAGSVLGKPSRTEGTVPLPILNISVVDSTDGAAEKSNDDIKLAKAQERQRKNRLAAARSNARRKLEMDTLKTDLQQEKEKVAMLERRRQELLSFNQHLKEQAANIWRAQARSTDGSS